MNETNRTAKLGLAVVMAVALTGFLGHASAAVNHVLQRTYISTGALFAFFPASFASAVDQPQTITCPGTSGTCTIQADHWIEVSGTTNGNESWGCLAVDGVLDANCGYNDDKVRPDGSPGQITSSHATSGIPVGTHTVQTFVGSVGGVNVYYYNINYRVYKP